MSVVRTVYTKSDLLALAKYATSPTVSDDVLKKFEVIEVGDPIPKRREERDHVVNQDNNNQTNRTSNNNTTHAPTTTNNSSNSNAQTSGSTNRHDRRGHREESKKHNTVDRFAPPPRSWRGTRDQEAFEEGYKYELERNAAHRKQLQETMQREDTKRDQTHVEPQSQPEVEDDEVEKLLAGIAAGGESKTGSRRSRFFTSNEGSSNEPAPPTTSSIAPPSVKDTWAATTAIWGNPTTMDPAAGPSPTAHGPRGYGNDPTTSNVVVSGTSQASVNLPQPTSNGVANVPSAMKVGSGLKSVDGQRKVWHAQDIENLLSKGVQLSALQGKSQQQSQPHPQKVAPPEQHRPVPIEVSELESMLIPKVRQSSGKSGSTPSTPPQQMLSGAAPPNVKPQQNALMHPQQQMGIPVPPQWIQMAQQGNPQPQTIPTKMPQPMQQAMQHHGMQIPMMMNAQGQYFAAPQNQAFFLPGQQSVVYSRPDGTVYSGLPQMGSFNPNQAFLFHQQPQQQQPPQQLHRR